MKKLVPFLMTLCLALFVTGCGKTETTTPEADTTQSADHEAQMPSGHTDHEAEKPAGAEDAEKPAEDKSTDK